MPLQIDEENDVIVFSTGTRIYANRCIVGVGPDGGVYEGYDGRIARAGRQRVELTPEEWGELADYAISAWQRLKDEFGPREV